MIDFHVHILIVTQLGTKMEVEDWEEEVRGRGIWGRGRDSESDHISQVVLILSELTPHRLAHLDYPPTNGSNC